MRLTKLETEILLHRLEVPDCLAEALDEDPDEVALICCQLRTAVSDLEAHFAEDRSIHPFLARAILADCVEGSTFVATMESGMESSRKISAAVRAMESLAVKVGQLVGRVLEPVLS